ncbi:MAG: phytanoyl-CoA dioxygenase [Flavobacteriaceae bacterium]|nr:phytanoyl-CoA dioxygenase [Flavobacteriaceae bacterium]|tara:strand:+ start:6395 stop:7120 length:726 start_codon:yes stop_codon:yes gene_type:complete
MIDNLRKNFFNENGFLVIENVLSNQDLDFYDKTYNSFINNEFDIKDLRSDLSGTNDDIEYITQIMTPSRVYPELTSKPIHMKGSKIATELLGDDIVLDFDMLINKAPNTNKITPWHQDAAYWIDMPDKRALSIWFAIDNATVDNGCMWYTPKSHLSPVRNHFQPNSGGALQCIGDEKESTPVPLKRGSCVIHHGQTLHYSRGNKTNQHRRAFILNYRPSEMVDYERKMGFDHSGKREVRNN